MGGRKGATRRGTTWDGVCAAALSLPGVTEGTSYGTPALHVRKRLIARLKEDGKTIALRVDLADRDVLLELDPRAFFVTEHYRSYPAMLIRLAKAQPALLGKLLEDAWRRQAPKSMVSTRDASAPQPVSVAHAVGGGSDLKLRRVSRGVASRRTKR